MAKRMSDNIELSAACHAVLARLESDPTSVAEWEAIRDALGRATAYAKRMRDQAKRQAAWDARPVPPAK